ncbi:SGNH/GDSL hydrolase family protein [Verrucomicrobiaceae bacterium N1E253]|uniref:SGNH/GDSL hydrolase family protein n=1 Tax=Oceaniferula marina TaxID=2748318 RepID=A0A851GGS7_9BACT|nr:SGNH/GDSL hydrolase family protein [Oceaniferula marina]NWK54455.1 SGNH/GDSL hydrolase family protein [Oceaniferula marina]
MKIAHLSTTLSLLVCSIASAQLQWVDPAGGENWNIEGRIWNEPGYGRLPAKAKGKVRNAVWNLGKQSAGLKLRFWSNSPEIHLDYQLAGGLSMPHMAATGVSGFDLYRRTSEGKQFWVAATKPTKTSAKVKLASGLHGNPRVPSLYTLYLPLYNGVKSLKIGVAEGTTITPAKPDALKPIVVYGTSIAQGACASRPGVAWTAILERKLDRPLINLGFSGNGRMETEMADLMVEQDAAVYVIDCLPNLNAKEVQERIKPLLDRIRKTRPKTPLLLVEEAPRANAIWHPNRQSQLNQEWQALKGEFDRRKQTDPNLHYMNGKDILGIDGESTVDAVHPNDIGMMRYAVAYEHALRPILGMENIEVVESVPASPQLREIPGYNFLSRHQEILQRHKKIKPDVVWLGDSIIHFFSGEPKAPYIRGDQAWKKLFNGTQVTNLAYGWDRTENVLWRIQRGELDQISPKLILLSIGTNDLSTGRTPEQVSNAIITLVTEIKQRQPNARLIVTGILPRKTHAKNRLAVNRRLKESAQQQGYEYLDLSPAFPTTEVNGKKLISGMSPDQLHPNTEGYNRMGDLLKSHLDRF